MMAVMVGAVWVVVLFGSAWKCHEALVAWREFERVNGRTD
jgi:hypothetical protein